MHLYFENIILRPLAADPITCMFTAAGRVLTPNSDPASPTTLRQRPLEYTVNNINYPLIPKFLWRLALVQVGRPRNGTMSSRPVHYWLSRKKCCYIFVSFHQINYCSPQSNVVSAIPVSYLDLPDLDTLCTLNSALSKLTSDPILHRNRLRIVAPSRVQHSLFAQGCHGTLLRPSVGDLVRMNVMRGLGIERRWRLGSYFYSVQASRTEIS
jgi:hypothetical protein